MALIDLGEEGLQPGDTIDGYLDEFFQTGNEVIIPGGSYNWNGGGIGGSYGNATLRGDGMVFLEKGSRGIDFNLRNTGGTTVVKNITISGTEHDSGNRIAIWSTGGHLLLENFNRPDGVGSGADCIGFYVPPEHAGTVTLRDCTVIGWSNNGLYASAPGKASGGQQGQVVVEGGLYKNNNVASVRVGSDNSIVRNVTVVVDDTLPPLRGTRNGRGIWVREPGNNITIEDCDVTYFDISRATVPIYIQPHDPGGGSGVVRDCRLYDETGGDAIAIENTGGWSGSGNHITVGSPGPSSWYECVGGSCDQPTTEKQFVGDAGEPECAVDADCPEGEICQDGRCVPIPLDQLYDHNLVFQTYTGDPVTLYEFVVDGEAEPSADTAIESATEVIVNNDGTLTCRGQSGNGFTDEWFYTGAILSFDATDRDSGTTVSDPDRFTLTLDGSEISSGDLVQEPPGQSDIVVTNIELGASPVVGDPVTVFVDAENVGGQSGQATFDVDVNGSTIGSVTFSLESGAAGTDTVSWVPSVSGSVTITAGGAQLGTTVGSGDGGGGTEPPLQVTFGTVAVVGGVTILAYRYLDGKSG